MSWIDRLEKPLGWIAIPGITRIVVAFNALVFLLLRFNPSFIEAIDLQPGKVLSGEVWRLLTFVFIPETSSLLWIVFALLFLWFIGENLESEWGSFRLTLFYLLGMAGGTVAAFFFGGGSTNLYLNLSLLFAFATLFPNMIVMLFLIVPVKMKWIGLFSFVIVMLGFFSGGVAVKMAVASSLINYILFFGPTFVTRLRQRGEVAARRHKFESSLRSATGEALHRCHLCGRTDETHPDIEFRVGRDGEDYCTEHLPAHPDGAQV